MKILYDHQIFYRQYYGGVSRYFCELMNQFSLDPDISFNLSLRYIQNENLHKFPQLNKYWSKRADYFYNNRFFSFLQKKIHFEAKNFALNYIFNNRGESVRLLKKQNFDVFHPTYYEPYFLRYLQNKPYVLTVYDMTHEIFPNSFSANDQTNVWKKQLIEHAGAIIAISENTKTDILKFTDVDPDRVCVIHLGNPFEYSINFTQNNNFSDPPVFKEPYLLFVGGRGAYKNFNFFIESVAGLLCKYKELNVVCAGSLPFTLQEKRVLKKLNVLHKVHHVNTNDTSMKNLFKNAQAFIFPSLYEGFGLPVLEAFSCGCPAILSNSSSLPEIGGDAAIYFDPNNSNSIQTVVEDIVQNNSLQDSLRIRGYQRLKLFSWEKTAMNTKKVYDNLLSQ